VRLWTPFADRCRECGRRRPRRRYNPLKFAAGDRLLDASGNRILDASGNVMLDDGAGNGCCCCTQCPNDSNGDPVLPSRFCFCGATGARYNQIVAVFSDVGICTGSFACNNSICNDGTMNRYEVTGSWSGGTYTLTHDATTTAWKVDIPSFTDVIVKAYDTHGTKFLETNAMTILVTETPSVGPTPSSLLVIAYAYQSPSTSCATSAFIGSGATLFTAVIKPGVCLDGTTLTSTRTSARCTTCLLEDSDNDAGAPGYGGSVLLSACA
jgi:hypothetical protein